MTVQSAQPVWVTEAGSLGVVAENQFNQWNLSATESDGSTLFYRVIAGSLPVGVYLDSTTGILAGIPTTEVSTGADVLVSGADVTSKFAVRAYTTTNNQASGTIKRIADRTFTITVAGQSTPVWLTPEGSLGAYYNGLLLSPGIQLQYIDENVLPGISPVTLVSGQLPPGLSISSTGLISGFILPNPVITVEAGYSRDDRTPTDPNNYQGFDQYPFDFESQSPDYTYQFTLKVSNGRTSSLRTFSMQVLSTTIFNASAETLTANPSPPPDFFTDPMSADNNQLRASISSADAPIVLNTQGSIGSYRNDNFFAYQFTGYDINNYALGFEFTPITPDWPEGLQLNPTTGWLYGYIPNLGLTELTYDFAVRAYLLNEPTIISDPFFYSITFIGAISSNVTWLTPSNLGTISNGGTSLFYVEAKSTSNLALEYRLLSGSNSKLPEGLTLLPSGNIIGRVSFDNFSLDNNTTTIDNNTTTFDLTYTFTVTAYSANGYINVNRTFSITVLNTYGKPYNNLYIECMPPESDRSLIGDLINNTSIFPPALLFRNDDPNFGVAKNVVYNHAYGLSADTLENYVTSLQLNHYWKNLTLGQIKTARALDDLGNVIYEVVYSQVVDTLVNNDGEPADKNVVLPYPINAGTSGEIDVVYPNSLVDMRDQVIDVVGQESNILPRWMMSKQTDGNVLGFTPAWVIAYTQPGKSGQIAYNIQTQFGTQLNKIDFEADRYELDRSLTKNWDPNTNSWQPAPSATTFDINYHYNVSVHTAGTGFRVGDIITIYGDDLGGTTPLNDLQLVVNTVNTSGAIINAFAYGTADLFAAGKSYLLSGNGGSGTGDYWNITIPNGAHYSFTVAVSGTGYKAGDVITIPGTSLGGDSPANDLVITVNSVNSMGSIIDGYCSGIANVDLLSIGPTSYTLVVGLGGTGSGARWNVAVDPGDSTTFDFNSLEFISPSDIDNNTQAYDRYLLYPKRDILGGVATVGPQGILWTNTGSTAVPWINDSNVRIVWLEENP